MKLTTIIDSAELAERVAREAEPARHTLIDDPKKATVLVVEVGADRYLTRLRRALIANTKLDVVALVDHERDEEIPAEATDYLPVVAAEGALTRRLAFLASKRRSTRRRDLLAHAVESAGDVVEIASPNAILQYVNPAFTRLLGYSADEVLGRTPAQVMRSTGIHSREYFENIDRALQAGEVWTGMLVSAAKDGRLVHFEATVAPIFSSTGEITHHMAVKRDVTARLAAEASLRATNEELAQARDAALEANRVKSQFLANMSHELRTPLNAIIGYSEMLAEEAEDLDDSEAFIADLNKICTAGRHLLDLINNLLDLSKIETGKMELYLEEVVLGPLLDDTIETLRPLAQARGNKINLEIELDDTHVRADKMRLKQVVFNLLSNANKFSDGGVIDVILRRDADDTSFYNIVVRDQGIGMTEDEILRLFRPFVQADASTTRKFGGTGLGLVISQSFCQMMGGHISVESDKGKGATFTIRLPLESTTMLPISTGRPPSSGGKGSVVLVIDDDDTVHDLLRRTLSPAGFTVYSARGGDEGLRMVRDMLPDVVILDVVMPEMDGWSVLTSIKKDESLQDTPVIMLTFQEARATGLALGAADYLVKPVEPARVVRLARKYCGAMPARVLIVEDDPDARELLRRAVVSAGHVAHLAVDGEDGLTALGEKRPDMILLDLMMPRLDGFSFLEAIRSKAEHADIPVIVVTAKALTPDERARLDGAAQQIIAKGDSDGPRPSAKGAATDPRAVGRLIAIDEEPIKRGLPARVARWACFAARVRWQAIPTQTGQKAALAGHSLLSAEGADRPSAGRLSASIAGMGLAPLGARRRGAALVIAMSRQAKSQQNCLAGAIAGCGEAPARPRPLGASRRGATRRWHTSIAMSRQAKSQRNCLAGAIGCRWRSAGLAFARFGRGRRAATRLAHVNRDEPSGEEPTKLFGGGNSRVRRSAGSSSPPRGEPARSHPPFAHVNRDEPSGEEPTELFGGGNRLPLAERRPRLRPLRARAARSHAVGTRQSR